MALLEVNSVSKSFGALRAINDVTFTIEEGEIFGIAGPNGSGKSTLFNVISKIPFGPDTGTILFNGSRLKAQSAHAVVRRGLVRTFQREMTFESLNIYENALLGAQYGGVAVPPAEVRDVLLLVGFREADFSKSARNISVFDRKRLMLASAVACRPKLILLDEPASGLTKPEIDQLIALVLDIHSRRISIALIEHVLPFLMALSKRLMVLNNGGVIAIGEPHEVMKDPAVSEAYLGARKVAA
ncbi:ABC transporter ATP-binding protein [Mesorhizobium sp. AaZ16]|uniref:ABC transporter ATP-binding protein n=1 Tax=Mesorhizobium sp. AaZ16 TaxID=3402289 RepID=UPI00374EDC6D